MANPVKGRWWMEGRHFFFELSTWVPSAPEACFDYVSDFSRHQEWATNEVRIKPVDDAPVGVGKRLKAVGVELGKEWPSDLEVTAFEKPKLFAFTATGGSAGRTPEGDPHTHQFTFTPADRGTRIDVLRTDPFSPSWPTWFRYWFPPILASLAMPIRKKTVANLARRLGEMGVGQAKSTAS